MKRIEVALAGNPNVGKTSLLNHMAGTNLKIGNWPGVTVEKKEGVVFYKDYEIHLVDLPGIYTLEPISDDEWIAYNYLTTQRPDVILNVIETPNMERDLLLTVELLEMELPMVIALNMVDEAQKLGIEVDVQKMSELLGVPVIKTNGRTGLGVRDLLEAIVEVYERGIKPHYQNYSREVEELLLKYAQTGKESKRELIEGAVKDLGSEFSDRIRDERYALAHGLYKEVVKRSRISSRDITEALDQILLHPVLGVPVFFFIMFYVFKISFDFSSPLIEWIQGFIDGYLTPLSMYLLSSLGLPELFVRFVSEALFSGVGFVISFVPLIATLFALITFMEISGYLPRVAFLMDRFMHKFGLHGKSILPLLLGFGCNVPAIMSARMLESRRDKMLVIAMIPFMSCPARLVVFSFFAYTFFKNPALVIFSLYMLGVVIAFFTAFLLKKSIYRGTLSHFIMELPPYRLPTFKLIYGIVWAYVKSFLYRAGTLILAVSIIIWFLVNLPPGKGVEESYASKIGRMLTPVFAPIGIDNWKVTTSLIPAFLAREIALSSMATIYAVEQKEEKEFKPVEGLKEQVLALGKAIKKALLNVINPKLGVFEKGEENQGLREVLSKAMTPASALSFMVFLLIYTSCLGTVSVMWKEAGRTFALVFLAYSFVIAWLMSFLVYRISSSV
ncbi:ferrous iron transport protein B [Thermocrinis minervae]|uniref:Ferrous iron transport protein B n=1 Tax=Thermocrinis minervae TaxID=381751 RepID=A0A1M6SDX6_9AQUI|nr:ferrous iron transport protein B [Thermocrinis minervae]SHK42875.1 ferrous iron transport protein B [Thermocrinis minervae]